MAKKNAKATVPGKQTTHGFEIDYVPFKVVSNPQMLAGVGVNAVYRVVNGLEGQIGVSGDTAEHQVAPGAAIDLPAGRIYPLLVNSSGGGKSGKFGIIRLLDNCEEGAAKSKVTAKKKR